MISTNAGPEFLAEQSVGSPTKGFWQSTLPTLPAWQIWFVATSDTFSNRLNTVFSTAFYFDLGRIRFGIGCIGDGRLSAIFPDGGIGIAIVSDRRSTR